MHTSPASDALTLALTVSVRACPLNAADVSSIVATYHELALNIADTLETRLVHSLQLSTPDDSTSDNSTARPSLAAILHRADLAPATLSAALPGCDVSAVWWRLYGRWRAVRELDVLLLGMMAGDQDAERMDEVERRMRALGWELPAADAIGSSSGSRTNDPRGEAA